MSEFNSLDSPSSSSGGQRIKGVTLVKPIIFGNVSKNFGKKRESDGHTHEWTVYVKPYQNEDMSNYVKKVQFRLHESYANANRVVSKPPYEVSETGWGEFEVQIKIHFNDAGERPVTFYHVLKLFHTTGSAADVAGGSSGGNTTTTTTAVVQQQGRKTVVSECYDEIIFHEPTQYIHTLLTTTRPITLDAYKHETDFEEKKKKTLENIRSGRVQVQTEISELKDKLQLAKETITKFKIELAKAQKERGEEAIMFD